MGRLNMRYFLLLFFATNSFALNWEGVDFNESLISYVDTDSIQKSKGMIYYWNLFDYKKKITLGKVSFRSTSMLLMTDCELDKSKTLRALRYEKHMAKGNVVSDRNYKKSQSWTYNPPGSIGAQTNAYVCSLIYD